MKARKISAILLLLSLFAISACEEEDNPITTDFEASDTVVLVGTEVIFTDLSIGGSTTWEWTFEGGTPSSSILNFPTVTYTTPGTYDVTLVTTNFDNNKDLKHKADYIKVLDNITADFSLDNIYIEAGSAVTFTDLSTGEPTSWQWNFPGGNPSSSTEQNPVVMYENEGEYDVTLTASHNLSSDNITKVKTIIVRRAVSHYKLDGNANDSGPLKLEGTVHGATLTTDRNQVANAAYSFDGIDDYIEMPYNHLTKDLPVSISFWVKFNVLNDAILCTDFVPNQYSGVFFTASEVSTNVRKLGVSYGNGGGISPAGRKTLLGYQFQADTWYHIVGVVDSDNSIKQYVNGVEVEGSYTGTADSYLHTMSYGTLGKTGNPSTSFNGKLDDFRIYNKVLSAQEVMSIYSE